MAALCADADAHSLLVMLEGPTDWEQLQARTGDLRVVVAADTAEELAGAVCKWAEADIGLAESGMAGPTGREPGLFWIALCVGKGARPGIRSKEFRFSGDRIANQRSCAEAALQMLLQPPS